MRRAWGVSLDCSTGQLEYLDLQFLARMEMPCIISYLGVRYAQVKNDQQDPPL